MNTYQEQLETHLPDIQEFLTSLFLEDTKITINTFEETEAEETSGKLQENDIVLYSRDENLEMDVFVILDEEWFGLLSSVMLGVEEKKFNDVTKDLLKKFSGELSETLKKKMDEEGEGEPESSFSEVEVYQLSDLDELEMHTQYFYGEMEVEGLADDSVRAAILIGNPEFQKEIEVPEEVEEEVSDEVDEQNEEKEEVVEEPSGVKEEVVSAKYIEFEDFDDTPPLENEDGNSMDLLKDVEMDVSVELGRIELPLGKVLQLAKGSVIELEKLAGEPVDILVNGQRIAHGEVVVIDEHFGVRISNLITTRQRLASLS